MAMALIWPLAKCLKKHFTRAALEWAIVIHKIIIDGERSFTYTTSMSKQKLERVIRREIQNLNETIDWKIVKGLSYKSEASRHKFLLQRLAVAL